jgi:hypothetical protein
LGTWGRRFKSYYLDHRELAQLAEYLAWSQEVIRSSRIFPSVLSQGSVMVKRWTHYPEIEGSTPFPVTNHGAFVYLEVYCFCLYLLVIKRNVHVILMRDKRNLTRNAQIERFLWKSKGTGSIPVSPC